MAVTKKLNQLSLVNARKGIIQAEFSATDLLEACLRKIKETDGKIHAFLTICEKQARNQAKNADKLLSGKNKKEKEKIYLEKPLLGIPIAVKDNYCTKGIKTTAGSKVLENYIPQYNATVVEKIIDAGAVIIGKTNMDAWAHGSSTETSDFFTTKNPHDLSRVPGGSSGGSAAAVAADQVIAALGTETAGSIRQPASWCGVTGLKPTYGRVSRWGVIAMASSTDSPGPITKTAKDAAIILSVISGNDSRDSTSLKKDSEIYQERIDSLDPKKITIGVPKQYFSAGIDKQVRKKVEKALDSLNKLGFIIKPVSLLDPKYSIAVYTIVQRAEVSSNLARYDGIRFGNPRNYFGKEAKRRIMLGTYVLSAGYYDQYYLKAQKVRKLIVDDFKKAFSDVDLLIAPTSPSLPLKIGESEKEAMFGELQDVLVEASSLAGLPAINTTCGWVDNLPVGMQIIGPRLSEKLILKVANFFETNINLKNDQ
jgi:aspartyl-tRNA(Asn)/glutamyl-tRNA(Gln) amidotransferase subunit A